MAVEGGMKCVKFLLFFFNFIFWLCGLALIVLGVVVQVLLHKTPMIKDASGSAAPLVLIIIGVIIFLVSFFGCCGAWKENYCMVTMFAIFISLIIVAEIATAITAYVFRAKLSDIVDTNLKDMISQYKNNTEYRKGLDEIQHELKCCGATNYTDWASFKPDGTSVPDSCCINVTKDCGLNAMHSQKIYTKGCLAALEDQLKSKILWIAVAALIIAFIEFLGLVFSCMLMRGIRSGYEVM